MLATPDGARKEAEEAREALPATQKLTQELVSSPQTEPQTEESKPKRRRTSRIGFSTVEIYTHDARLAGDRVPSTSAPPVGLGALEAIQVRRVDSFDEMREKERVGVQFLEASERRNLVALSRNESVDEVEMMVELTRRQRVDSLGDATSPRGSVSSDRLSATFALSSELDDEPSLCDLFS